MSASEDVAYVDHPLLAPSFIERRLYQIRLAGTARDGHTLVCLPTGLGKTTVSLLVTAQRLHDVGGKSLFLAPTKPLVQQHADFYREALNSGRRPKSSSPRRRSSKTTSSATASRFGT
jgi:ERCC4-related helicase